MRNIFCLLFLTFLLNSCRIFPGMVGEGEVVKRTIDLPAFHSIKSSISGDIILTQAHDGKPQVISLEGQNNILDNLKMEVENGICSITFEEPVSSFKKLVLSMDIKTLRSVALWGSGKIESPATFYKLGDLDISISGSGNVILKPEAVSIDCGITGSGDISLFGVADELKAKVTDSGEVNSLGLVANRVEAKVTGSGDIKVIAQKSLDARISGSGDIYYKGSPKVNTNITGSGSVRVLE